MSMPMGMPIHDLMNLLNIPGIWNVLMLTGLMHMFNNTDMESSTLAH